MHPGNSGRALLLELLAGRELPEAELLALMGVYNWQRQSSAEPEAHDQTPAPEKHLSAPTADTSSSTPPRKGMLFWAISERHLYPVDSAEPVGAFILRLSGTPASLAAEPSAIAAICRASGVLAVRLCPW